MYKRKTIHRRHLKISDHFLRLLISILAFLFLAGIVYIPVTNQLGYVNESVVIETYIVNDHERNSSSESDEDDDIRNAIEYNRVLAEQQAREPFFYRGSSEEDDTYKSQLKNAGGVMCVLEIPSINVCLPVGHGTSDEVLETMAGHVCGTSLPVGGPSTNAVIAAHSGSTSARLFTDLGKLMPGDDIFVHVGSGVLTYRVLSADDISVVLPFDGNEAHSSSPAYDVPYFQIIPGEDLVTLYTCTPVGINSHRLIVRAHRINDRCESSDETHELHLTARKLRGYVFAGFLILLPFIASVIIFRCL